MIGELLAQQNEQSRTTRRLPKMKPPKRQNGRRAKKLSHDEGNAGGRTPKLGAEGATETRKLEQGQEKALRTLLTGRSRAQTEKKIKLKVLHGGRTKVTSRDQDEQPTWRSSSLMRDTVAEQRGARSGKRHDLFARIENKIKGRRTWRFGLAKYHRRDTGERSSRRTRLYLRPSGMAGSG